MATKVINTILNLQDNMSAGLIKAARNTKGVSNEMVKATRSVVSFQNKAVSAAKSAAKGIVAAGIAGAVAFSGFAGQSGMAFEAQMSKVASISGATAAEMQSLTEAAQNMGMETKFTASESGQALEYMAMAGWKTQQMLSGLPGIINLAAASGEELGTVSDIVTDALTAFNLKAEDAAHFSDVLAQAASSSNTDVGIMGETFKYVGTMAGALGYSIEDVATATGLMANAGVKGTMAGTALNSILSRLSTNTSGAADAIEALGVCFFNADGSARGLGAVMRELREATAGMSAEEKSALAKTVAGVEAQKGLLAILNAEDEAFNDLASAIANSDGAAQRMADTANDNLAGDLTLLGSAAEGVGITFYNAISGQARGAVQELTDKITELKENGTIDQWANRVGDGLALLVEKGEAAVSWLVENKDTVIKVGKSMIAIFAVGKVLTFVAGIVQAVQTVGLFAQTVAAVAMANPIGLAVAGAVVSVGLLIANWDTAKERAGLLLDKINTVFWGIEDAICGAFDSAKETVSGFFDWAGEKLGWLDDKISSVPVLGAAYTGIKGAASAAWDYLTAPASSLGVAGHALGTPYFGGGLTRVNERGGEILRLPSGTQIIPHDISQKAAGGRAINVHVTVQGNVIGNEDYANEMGERIAAEIIRALDNT